MSSFDFNYLLRSPSGKIKIAAVVVGFLAVVFCGAGHAHHNSDEIDAAYQQDICEIGETKAAKLKKEYKEKGYTVQDDDQGYFERCLRFSFGQAGLAFVIIAWLFSVVIMIISAMPSMIEQPLFRKIDAFGHIGAGVVDILGFLLLVIYVYNVSALGDCNREGVSDEAKSLCTKGFFWQVTVEYQGINGTKVTKTSGSRMIIWIFGALIALAHGIVCIVIFMLVKKAQGQTGPMMMANQTASQAPPGSFPSQAGSQQQAPPPEQQPSGHHSKHSQKV